MVGMRVAADGLGEAGLSSWLGEFGLGQVGGS